MPRPGFADRNRLKNWADSVASRTEFPRLVRRLILESTPGVVQLGMPAGEGVSAGSWDGTVRSTTSNAWVPAGLSVWELSVDSSPGAKADDDYSKRLTAPDGGATQDCTYVEAILRPWTHRSDWSRDRTAEGRWKEVRAHALDEIEMWLEASPVTWAWFSEQLGLNPHGMRSGDFWWSSWSSMTNPSLSPAIVLSGRDAELTRLVEMVDGPPRVVTLAGQSVEEAIAFLTAAAINLDTQGQGQLLARLALVDDRTTWRGLLESPTPLVLVPLVDGLSAEVPAGSIHHVLVPVTTRAPSADISLPPIAVGPVAEALRASGLDERRAENAARLARLSLTAMRRSLATQPALHVPTWASPPVARGIRAALLAGSWSEKKEGDKTALALLAGVDYESLRDQLTALASAEDPIVVRVGDSWHVVSSADAWLLLVSAVTEDDLKRFEAIVSQVLLEPDPSAGLPAEDRWKAAFEGRVQAHSPDLRKGIAETICLLAVHGGDLRTTTGTGSDWSSYLVRTVLAAANEDLTGETWAVLSGLLPLLAEAAPDRFIDAVRKGVSDADPVLATIFRDQDDQGLFGPHSPHTGLLWALEAVAWSSPHFGASIDLLARLDALDPGGRFLNRPFNSIASILCPWHPETSASPERRLEVLDGLRDRFPELSWRLMLRLLPELHGHHSPTNGPRFREWKPQDPRVTNVEYFNFIAEVVNRVVADAGADGARWAAVADKLSDLPPDDMSRVLGELENAVRSERLLEPSRHDLWAKLRDIVKQHREFADAAWALPGEIVDRLDTLCTAIVPADATTTNEWLFVEHVPTIGDMRRRDDVAAYDARLAELRTQAAREIDAESGLAGITSLAQKSVISGVLGWSLAGAVDDKYSGALLGLLVSDDAKLVELSGAYFARLCRDRGWEWLGGLLDENLDLDPTQVARLLLGSRDYPASWNEADSRGDAVATAFWLRFPTFGLGHDFAFVALVAERLMKVGRNAAALDFLNMYSSRSEIARESLVELIATGLEGILATGGDDEIHVLQGYEYESLFAILQEAEDQVGTDRLARLEWSYLPTLGHEPNARALFGRMATDGDFFVEILLTVYRPTRETDEAVSEEDRRRAMNAYQLLSSWSVPPGLVNGNMDASELRRWFDSVTEKLSHAGRLEIGLSHIGQVLVSAPADDDGSWPPRVVRDFFESVQLEELEDGFRVEIANRRGVTSRGLEDGGTQEIALAAKYRADADRYADRWPRTARVLRDLAKSYDSEARRNEDSAERFRGGLER
ncbi:MAG: hypothetical protein ACKO91_14410 [Acidimicrobiales bacterium]